MSSSYRTDKREVIARRRIKRDASGKPVLPRVVERKPHHGDSHPIRKTYLRQALRYLPEVYLYGLKRIELLPRKGEVGRPYATYRPGEKAIRLYSLPMTWSVEQNLSFYAEELNIRWGAELTRSDDDVTIHWPEGWLRELWFFMDVFVHELGHHYRNQYRARDKRAAYNYEELIADLHAARFFRRKTQAIRARNRS